MFAILLVTDLCPIFSTAKACRVKFYSPLYRHAQVASQSHTHFSLSLPPSFCTSLLLLSPTFYFSRLLCMFCCLLCRSLIIHPKISASRVDDFVYNGPPLNELVVSVQARKPVWCAALCPPPTWRPATIINRFMMHAASRASMETGG